MDTIDLLKRGRVGQGNDDDPNTPHHWGPKHKRFYYDINMRRITTTKIWNERGWNQINEIARVRTECMCESGTRMDFKDIILEGWRSFTWMMWFQLSVYPIADGSMELEGFLCHLSRERVLSTLNWQMNFEASEEKFLASVIKALNLLTQKKTVALRQLVIRHQVQKPKVASNLCTWKRKPVKCPVKLCQAVGYVDEAEYIYRHTLQWNELWNIGL